MSEGGLPVTLAGFRNFHEGKSIVVCGCGSSLSAFTRPERFVTIGVNDVGRLFQPDYLVVLNPRQQFTGDRFRHVEESRAKAIFTQLDLRLRHPHVVRFRLGKRGGTEPVDPNVLHYTRNSPYVALCLAMHMGAKRIGLIGVDFTDHHFFGRTGRHSLARELPQIDSEYRRLGEVARRLGIEVFNLSESSRITAFPKISADAFARLDAPPLRIVSYATTPVAGVPPVLARCIAERTPHEGRAVWARAGYGNGVVFDGDVEYTRSSRQANALLDAADVVIVHNGKVDARHVALIDSKPVVTLAHNYKWNVDETFVQRGMPGLVVAQYQATLPEFALWTPVPNPIPFWEPAYAAGEKGPRITIAFTPSGKHERYPEDHHLYWHAKGYRSTMAVLERLAARRGIALEVIRNAQISHARSMEMKRRAHIVIDECVTGSYHRNSLEGLAAGAVVVNGVGRLAGVAELLRDVSGSEEVPFVAAGLDDLEAVLEKLIARGAAALAEEGARGRRWLEAHWDFGRQWSRFWQPAIETALQQRGVVQASGLPSGGEKEAGWKPAPHGHGIVIPFGGRDRLPLLERTLLAVAASGASEVIVVEMAEDEPCARDAVAAAGFQHVFIRDVFHKTRAMNAGAARITSERFFWLDADIVATPPFFANAVAEMDERKLDCLVPWTTVGYLTGEDTAAVLAESKSVDECKPQTTYRSPRASRGGVVLVRTSFVREYGGMCEEFRGWGAEDDAWFAKARCLGTADVTRRRDQHVYHLHHENSGGARPGAALALNPHYRRNVALFREVRSLRTRERFLQRFPAVPLRAEGDPPWGGEAARPAEPRATAVLPAGRQGPRLNLGCCDDVRRGFVNVDRVAGRGVDAVVDLAEPWPWNSDSVDEIRAWDIIEHLPDKVRTMNEMWRVLRPGATAEIAVPTTDGPGAFQDPTHVSFWNRRSFLYYEHGNPYRERFARSYGIEARFRVRSERTESSVDGPRLHIVLEAVKP